jgi:hypothetical protein
VHTYLAIAARDIDGGQLEVEAAELLDADGEIVEDFVDDFMLGISLNATTTPLGSYMLRVTVAQRPKFVFNVQLQERNEVRGIRFATPTPLCASLVDNRATKGKETTPTLVTLTLTLGNAHEEIVLVAGWGYESNSSMTPYATSYRDDQYSGATNYPQSKTLITKNVPIPQRLHDYTIVTTFNAAPDETGFMTYV